MRRLTPVTSHPVWEIAPPAVVKHRVALLGDAAHMASPRTGAGAYTAMVDAVAMGSALQRADGDVDRALGIYNRDTVSRGNDLYRRSRAAADHFAPAGLVPVSPSLIT